MPSVSATVDVQASADTVYAYLEGRYDRTAHRSASLATKGYVPNVTCVEAVADKRLVFEVAGRDALLRILIGGWTWSYDIEPTSASASRVIITYHWSWLMSLLGAGTTYHQACNEVTETAMALDALGWSCAAQGTASAEKMGGNQHIVEIRRGKRDVTGIRAEQDSTADRSHD